MLLSDLLTCGPGSNKKEKRRKEVTLLFLISLFCLYLWNTGKLLYISVSMGTNDLSYSSCESFPGRLCPGPCVQVYFCMAWHTMVYYFMVCYLMVDYGRSPVICTHVLMSKCSFPSPSFVETSKVTTFRPMFRQMFKSMFKPTYYL